MTDINTIHTFLAIASVSGCMKALHCMSHFSLQRSAAVSPDAAIGTNGMEARWMFEATNEILKGHIRLNSCKHDDKEMTFAIDIKLDRGSLSSLPVIVGSQLSMTGDSPPKMTLQDVQIEPAVRCTLPNEVEIPPISVPMDYFLSVWCAVVLGYLLCNVLCGLVCSGAGCVRPLPSCVTDGTCHLVVGSTCGRREPYAQCIYSGGYAVVMRPPYQQSTHEAQQQTSARVDAF